MIIKTCSFCGKEFGRLSFVDYLYRVKDKYFCCYTCYKRVKYDGKTPKRKEQKKPCEILSFSERKQMWEICDKYFNNNGILMCSQSVVTYLYGLGLIKVEEMKLYLEGENATRSD